MVGLEPRRASKSEWYDLKLTRLEGSRSALVRNALSLAIGTTENVFRRGNREF